MSVFEEPFRLVSRLRWLDRQSWLWQRQAVIAALAVVVFAIPFVLPMSSGGASTGTIEDDLLGAGSFDLSSLTEPSNEVRAEGEHRADRPDDQVFYQRNVTRRNRFLLGFRVDSEIIGVSELWVGPDFVVTKEQGRTLIVCFAESSLTYIDHRQEVWAETSLPLDLQDILSRRLRHYLRETRSYGVVEETDRTKKIGGVECKEYRVNSWQERAGEVKGEVTMMVHASEDTPCSLRTFHGYLDVMRRLLDRDDGYRRELSKIRGPQLRLELRRGGIFLSESMLDRLDEMKLVSLPPEIFDIPDDYRRVSRLREVR